MSSNKQASLRYSTLDRCLSNRQAPYNIDGLLDACNQALFEINSNSFGIGKRQLYKDLKVLKEEFGAEIEIVNNGYYQYVDRSFSIYKDRIQQWEADQLKQVIDTLTLLKGLPNFRWIEDLKNDLQKKMPQTNETIPSQIIHFEENEQLVGSENIPVLFNAILHQTVLKIRYQAFHHPRPIDVIFHPYVLKQYGGRWFIVGLNEVHDFMMTLALDRIKNLEYKSVSYKKSRISDFSKYFNNMIGATLRLENKIELVKLKIAHDLWPYLKTKPLHHSQKFIKDNDQYVFIQLELIPNYELEALILKHGERMVVLEPITLCKRIQERVAALNQLYIKN